MFITKTGPQPVRTGQDQVLVLDWSGPVPGLRSSMVLVFCGPGPGPFKKWWSSPGPGPWSFQKRQKDRTGPDQPTLVSRARHPQITLHALRAPHPTPTTSKRRRREQFLARNPRSPLRDPCRRPQIPKRCYRGILDAMPSAPTRGVRICWI